MIYVVPQVVGVFRIDQQKLPLITLVMLGLSRFLKATFLAWLAAGAGAFILCARR